MSVAATGKTIREAVGVFRDAETLEAAVAELESSGFDRADISLLAGEDTVREKLGHRYKAVSELENDGKVPRAAFVETYSVMGAEGSVIGALTFIGAVAAVGAVVASGGTLAAAITAAALSGGTGGLIGSSLAKFIGDHHAEHLQKQINHGGLLLWVRTWTPEQEKRATEILSRHSAFDVHLHDLPSYEE